MKRGILYLKWKAVNNITANREDIQHRVIRAAIKSGRNPDDVKILLATKTVSVENIKSAFIAGLNIVGENKVQELKAKYDYLASDNTEMHFIGHLQTNKIKDVLKYASCIQSVDRPDLIEKLDQRLQYEGRKINIMMQVNTSYEESKFGISPENALSLAKMVSKYDTLNVTGLMTIGLFSKDINKVRKCYQLLKNLQLQVQELGLVNFTGNELSMGMSNDFEIAIAEGATMIRVGTAIFGDRIYPDSYYWNEQKDLK